MVDIDIMQDYYLERTYANGERCIVAGVKMSDIFCCHYYRRYHGQSTTKLLATVIPEVFHPL